ncbi:MAG: hypothetical protein IPG56_20255 [Caulobacteraceae bacterium]|nr:hypothetical protein [Caulobacteraceae bacterium]
MALPIYFASGGARLTRCGLIGWRFGFGTLTLGAVALVDGGGGTPLVALLLATGQTKDWFGEAALALIISVLALGLCWLRAQ